MNPLDNFVQQMPKFATHSDHNPLHVANTLKKMSQVGHFYNPPQPFSMDMLNERVEALQGADKEYWKRVMTMLD
ncbi:hypothetical protein QTV44_002489 [Vibrio vulnificus]|nr:hypothetical protein [Vibrio vulnificus]